MMRGEQSGARSFHRDTAIVRSASLQRENSFVAFAFATALPSAAAIRNSIVIDPFPELF
jgi:hypothetical protein